MRLAHPQRMCAFMDDDINRFTRVLGPEWSLVRKALEDPTFCLAHITRFSRENKLPLFSSFLHASARMESATEYGGSAAFLVGLRQHVSPAPHFLIDDNLVELLHHTDMAEDIPLDMLQLPYRRLYLELGTRRDLELTIENAVSGQHILEGAYLEQAEDSPRGPGLYIVLTGSPLGKQHVMDDATQAVFLATSDPQRPLAQALREAMEQARLVAVRDGLNLPSPETYHSVLQALVLVAKALLYVNLPEARRTTISDRSQALQEAARLKNPAKRAKAERRAQRLRDCVLIQAPPPPADSEEAASLREGASRTLRRGHWRRGHYRMQPHGPQRLQRKLIFIRPTLVGPRDVVAPPSYVAR